MFMVLTEAAMNPLILSAIIAAAAAVLILIDETRKGGPKR